MILNKENMRNKKVILILCLLVLVQWLCASSEVEGRAE